jgi:hypothetical protein
LLWLPVKLIGALIGASIGALVGTLNSVLDDTLDSADQGRVRLPVHFCRAGLQGRQ